MSEFVHLSVHSEYSLQDSVLFLKRVAPSVKNAGMNAVALTDKSNLFAMVKFQESCFEHGIKPIFGCDLQWEGLLGRSRLLVLAANQAGYHSLFRLVTSAAKHPDTGLSFDELSAFNEGVIVLSGGTHGEVGQLLLADDADRAQKSLERFKSLLGDRFYVELTRTGRLGENDYLERVVDLADRADLPLVATNDVIMTNSSDFSLHDAKMCIQHRERMDGEYSWKGRYSQHQYFRTSEEMSELFADLPDAIENTVEIAKRCNVEVETGVYFQRPFPHKEPNANKEELRQRVFSELGEFLKRHGIDEKNAETSAEAQEYRQRSEYELSVIEEMGYSSYFLIVNDIVQWARDEQIPVGPGRGSGAASLVAMLLGITNVDPIKHNLYFERLLNLDRKTMPDLDIDFCADRRDRVLSYIIENFDRDCVGLIATQGTHAAKSIIHGMARAFGYAHSDVNQITKLIPTRPGITLKEAYEQEPGIQETADARGCSDLLVEAERLEGIVSQVGVHPAGVVIAPSRLDNYVPCHIDSSVDLFVTQLDKDDVEKVGMVKYDLLSLKNLTVIQKTVDSINSQRSAETTPFDVNSIPLDDEETYRLIASSETEGVFQLESDGMKNLILRLRPDTFDDIIALVALFRPGPLNANIHKSYALRKHGQEPIQFDHPLLETVLKSNYGLMIFQEDVMSVARTLAGFSGADADILREAMGKKRQEKLATLKNQFIEGCSQNDIGRRLAEGIFEKMQGFSEYAFNRAHATAYAVVTYQTAFLKCHYPREYMGAVASVESADPKRLGRLLGEAVRMGLVVQPPEINTPSADCSVTDTGFRLGLKCLKGVGYRDIQAIVEEYERGGQFSGLFDLCSRTDTSKLDRKSVESLIKVGSFDSLEDPNGKAVQTRATLLSKLDRAYQAASEKRQTNGGLFGDPEEAEVFDDFHTPQPLTVAELQTFEHETLGYVLSAGSSRLLFQEFRPICTHSLDDARRLARGTQVTVAGVIKQSSVRELSRGGEVANVLLQDQMGTLNVVVWPEQYRDYASLIIDDQFLVVKGRITYDRFNDEQQLNADRMFDVEAVRREARASICLKFLNAKSREKLTVANLESLKTLLKSQKKDRGFPFRMVIEREQKQLQVEFGAGFRKVPVTHELLSELRSLFSNEIVHVEFKGLK